jgi:tripartite-type tricarboxylate transporter receptor subunit TctC
MAPSRDKPFTAERQAVRGKIMTVQVRWWREIGRSALVIACFVAAGWAFAARSAEPWPTRNITAIVPFGAGSGADVITRVVMDEVAKRVGRPIIVENHGGAGGTIGSNLVAQAAPNGYTILATASLGSAHALYPNRPYDTLRDFASVIPLGQQPLVVVSAPAKGYATLAGLIAAAKARPGALNFASAGAGSASHFAAERLRLSAGFEAQHLPFRGGAEALTDVLAGRSDYYFIPLATGLPLISEGKLVALAVSTQKRASALPQVPSVAETLVDATYDFCVGLYVPAKTPRDIVLRLHKETEAVLRTPSMRERLAKLGVEPMPMSPDEFAKYFRDDVAANARIVALSKMRPQP